MSVWEVLRKIVFALDSAGIPYMLTGSFASTYYGVTRSTQDIDLVIAPTPGQLRVFAESLPGNAYYLDLEAAQEALSHRSLFNVLDLSSGWKVDLIILNWEFLDQSYLEIWIKDLGIEEQWQEARLTAGV